MLNSLMIHPLFYPSDQSNKIGDVIINLPSDNYNKSTQAALIDTKNDAEAIQSFLNEHTEQHILLSNKIARTTIN